MVLAGLTVALVARQAAVAQSRNPLSDADRRPVTAFYEKRVAAGATPRQAALDTLKLVLCSPSFLYLSGPQRI